jgi:hypothetical protein
MTGAAARRFSRSSYLRSPVGHPESPAVVVDDDGDVIRVVEGGCAAVQRGVVEAPLRRRLLPDQLGEIAPIFFVTRTAAIGREVELVPPFELCLWRQRHLAGLLAADQVAAHGDERPAAVRPDYAPALDDRAVAFLKLGRLEDSRKAMLRLAEVDPDSYATHANLGTLYTFTGEYDKALVHIDRAMALEPQAHFGREKYHRQLVQYLLDGRKDPEIFKQRDFLGLEPTKEQRFHGSEEAFAAAGVAPEAFDALVSMIAVYGADRVSHLYFALGDHQSGVAGLDPGGRQIPLRRTEPIPAPLSLPERDPQPPGGEARGRSDPAGTTRRRGQGLGRRRAFRRGHRDGCREAHGAPRTVLREPGTPGVPRGSRSALPVSGGLPIHRRRPFAQWPAVPGAGSDRRCGLGLRSERRLAGEILTTVSRPSSIWPAPPTLLESRPNHFPARRAALTGRRATRSTDQGRRRRRSRWRTPSRVENGQSYAAPSVAPRRARRNM